MAKIKNLVIVESPAKAHTIAGYLGKDFKVMSSVGHIRSIAKKAVKIGRGEKVEVREPIDTAHDFATIYEIDPEKKKTVAELKKAVTDSETVWLATDEDREGEAIAWHLCEVLGLEPAKTNRIVFHEITRDAIQAAVKNPRTIDMDLVKAQQARQILDRLVGFELSPVVWRKVPGGKSAGRVQSPAVKLLVEREREIAKFESSFTFKVSGEFAKNLSGIQNDNDDEIIKANLSRDFADESGAREFLASLNGAEFRVAGLQENEASRNPLPPFTTSTLQQDANSRLGMSARTTMSLAQSLYQSGFITYMRTDSLNLGAQFLGAAGNYISRTFGEKYLKIRKYHTKSAGAQEAHEAIRPTDPSRENISGDARAQKLYDLIRRRTLASQMASAKIERTTAEIEISRKGFGSRNASSARAITEKEINSRAPDGALRGVPAEGEAENGREKSEFAKYKDPSATFGMTTEAFFANGRSGGEVSRAGDLRENPMILTGENQGILRELLRETLENYALSATHLNNFLDVSRGGPENFLMKNLLKFPEAKTAQASFGSAIHTALQRAQRFFAANHSAKPLEDVLGDFTDALDGADLSERDTEFYTKKGVDALSVFYPRKVVEFANEARAEFSEKIAISVEEFAGKYLGDSRKSESMKSYTSGMKSYTNGKSRDLTEKIREKDASSVVQDDRIFNLREDVDGFANNLTEFSPIRLTGKIDWVKVDRENKTLVLADYKTGKPARSWAGKTDYEKIKLRKYRQQLLFYKILLENSREFQGWKVAKGYLEFVEPMANGEIARLEIDYESDLVREEMGEFAKLVWAIWRRILSLSLPDVARFSMDFAGMKEFEGFLVGE